MLSLINGIYLNAKHTFLHTHTCINTPPPFNFTDGWMQIQNAFQHLMGAVAVETLLS